jgi:hypothetical protein
MTRKGLLATTEWKLGGSATPLGVLEEGKFLASTSI